MNTNLLRVVKLVLNFSLFNILVFLFIEREFKMHYNLYRVLDMHIKYYIRTKSLDTLGINAGGLF